MNRGRWWRWLPWFTALAVVLLYAMAMDPAVLGFNRDDGVYAATGKALAEGPGFVLPSIVGMPAQIKYPALYPWLLSLIWRFWPVFPDNIVWMGILTIVCAAAGMLAAFYYLKNVKKLSVWVAYTIMLLTAGCTHMISAATVIYSEALYLLLSFLVLLAAGTADERLSVRRLTLLALLSTLVFQARIIGLTLILSIGCWLLLNRRWRAALGYLTVTSLLAVLPWWWWVHSHAPETITPLNYPILHLYGNYADEWLHNVQDAPRFFQHLKINLESMLAGLTTGMFLLFPLAAEKISVRFSGQGGVPWLGSLALLLPGMVVMGVLLLRFGKSLRQALQSRCVKISTPDGLYLGFYLLLLLVWGYPEQAGRFLCVVLPLVWALVFRFFQPLTLWRKRMLAALVTLAFLPMPLVYWRSYVQMRPEHLYWIDGAGRAMNVWPEYEAMFRFIRNRLPQKAVLASNHETLVYLYAGHAGYSLYDFRLMSGQSLADAPEKVLPVALDVLRQAGVLYVLVEPPRDARLSSPPEVLAEALIRRYSRQFKLMFRTPEGRLSLYRFLPENAALAAIEAPLVKETGLRHNETTLPHVGP